MLLLSIIVSFNFLFFPLNLWFIFLTCYHTSLHLLSFQSCTCIANLVQLHSFSSHLPHRAISSGSWQSCLVECSRSLANFELASSNMKYILCRPKALLALLGNNALNNAIYLFLRKLWRVATDCNMGQLLQFLFDTWKDMVELLGAVI